MSASATQGGHNKLQLNVNYEENGLLHITAYVIRRRVTISFSS